MGGWCLTIEARQDFIQTYFKWFNLHDTMIYKKLKVRLIQELQKDILENLNICLFLQKVKFHFVII